MFLSLFTIIGYILGFLVLVELIFFFLIPFLVFVSESLRWLVREVFRDAKAFNSDVSKWDVASVENMGTST